MKRILLISLLLIFCFSLSIEAKLKFGGWDKWEEEFPSPENHWDLMTSFNVRFLRYITRVHRQSNTKENIRIAMNCFVCKNKRCKEKMSVILVSPKDESTNEVFEGRGNYLYALVAFPPDKNKTVAIKLYEKVENGRLLCIEEWEIPYEHNYPVFNDREKLLADLIGKPIIPGNDLKLIIIKENKFSLLFDLDLASGQALPYLEKSL